MIVAFCDASPNTHTLSGALCNAIQPCVSLFTSLGVPRFFPSPTCQAVVNCFSSTAPLALPWLEIGVLTQRLEDGLYLTPASDMPIMKAFQSKPSFPSCLLHPPRSVSSAPPALAHTVAWHAVSVYQSPWHLTASLPIGMVHLAKVLVIKELAVWPTSDGVCYQSPRMLYSTAGHLDLTLLGSILQLWPSTSHSFTILHVLRQTDVHVHWGNYYLRIFGKLPICTYCI